MNAIQVSDGMLRVTLNSNVRSPVSMKLFNVQGKEIAVLPIFSSCIGMHTEMFNLSSYEISAGNYMVQLIADYSTTTAPVVLR